MPRRWHILATLLAFIALGTGIGCQHSRWALRDPDYALHYPRPAETNLQAAKQALDARHVEHKAGWFYGGGGGSFAETSGMAEIGRFHYHDSWLEDRWSVMGLYNDEQEDLYVGLNGGLRFQSPSRAAPFVGVGGYAGVLRSRSMLAIAILVLVTAISDADTWDDDHDTYDDDYFDDYEDPREGDNRFNPMFTVYPEVGMHFWLNSDTRLTTSLSYHFSTEGRDSDMLMLNFSLSHLKLPEMPHRAVRPRGRPRVAGGIYQLAEGETGWPADSISRLPDVAIPAHGPGGATYSTAATAGSELPAGGIYQLDDPQQTATGAGSEPSFR